MMQESKNSKQKNGLNHSLYSIAWKQTSNLHSLYLMVVNVDDKVKKQ